MSIARATKGRPATNGRPAALCGKIMPAILALGLLVPAGARSDGTLTEAEITAATAAVLNRAHTPPRGPSEVISSRFLSGYLDALDGSRLLFLQSDVDEFDWFRPTLAQVALSRGYTWPARLIYQRCLSRLAQQVEFQTNFLRTGKFTFAGHDEWQANRGNARRPANLAEARALWREEVRASYLREKVAGLNRSQIISKLSLRYERRFQLMRELGDNKILDIYLDALARAYDSNSGYLGRDEAREVESLITLSSVGIGGSLASRNGYWVLGDLAPGGPAARSGLLHVGDRILAVAQGSGDLEEVTEMPSWQVIDLIRGPKGSTVRLTILPAGRDLGASVTVSLVREDLRFDDGRARAAIVDLPWTNDTTIRLGIINLPLFYESNTNGESGASADTARLICKLKREGIKGLILDLRSNPGGSLRQAVDLAGLFLPPGPVLQTRDTMDRIEAERPGTIVPLYDGPMVVLTSRESASSAEIVAGALQDYGRALIVGDSSTFGKGTAQTLVPLSSIFNDTNLGVVKVTTARLYRPDGASTQIRGVTPELVLPSETDLPDVGEAQWSNALPWDELPPQLHTDLDLVRPVLPVLRARSVARVDADPGFRSLRKQMAAASDRATRSLILNEREWRRQRAEVQELFKQIDKARKNCSAHGPRIHDITLANVDFDGLPPTRNPADCPALAQAVNNISDDDLELLETERILADYTQLLSPTATETEVEVRTTPGRTAAVSATGAHLANH